MLMISVDSISEAASLVIEVDKLCTKSGFNLTKFVSTCPEILDKLPPGKGAEKTSVSLEINASIERALGVVWCLESDCLTFHIELKDTPFHKEEFCHLLAQYLIHWDLQVLSCYRVSEYYRLLQVKKGMG